MRLTTKLGERFSTVHSLIWRCLPSSSLSLNSRLIRLSLSDKWRRRGIMRMMGVPLQVYSGSCPILSTTFSNTFLMAAAFQPFAMEISTMVTSFSVIAEPALLAGMACVSRSFSLPIIMLSSTIKAYRLSLSRLHDSLYTLSPSSCVQ